MEITYKATNELAPLFCHFGGQTSPQDAYIEIDPDRGTMTAAYNGEIGNAVPFCVHHGRVLRYEINCAITEASLLRLLGELLPLAQRIETGYSCDWDGSNNVGSLDDDAEIAADQINDLCQATIENDYDAACDVVPVWEPADWLDASTYRGDTETTVGDETITHATSDGELKRIAIEIEADAKAEQIHLDGDAYDYLDSLREELRDCTAQTD